MFLLIGIWREKNEDESSCFLKRTAERFQEKELRLTEKEEVNRLERSNTGEIGKRGFVKIF